MIIFKTNFGDIHIELDPNTPKTSENFLNYVKNGHYDGTLFHRVINNFMIQGGGFDSDLQQKQTSFPVENEAKLGEKNTRGTIAMARTSDPHSATAQFFINVKDNDFLNFTAESEHGWGYCVFGKVVAGMDIVDKINQVETTRRGGHQDLPKENIIIEKVTVQE